MVWLALLIVACLAASLLGLIMVICSGIALLVYVPATLVISSKNSDSRFDSSAGEVGYLSVQMLVNIRKPASVNPVEPGLTSSVHPGQLAVS